MPIDRLRPKYIFDAQRIEQLKQIAPECFEDGKVHWETFKEALGNYEEGDSEEHFGLFWPGKREARKLSSVPSTGALVPVLGEGINEETSRNIFIEGENLEVLKLLQKSYANKIKVIYIDPPYNTGNDFVYDDNFIETIEEYQKRTGQIDEEGRKLTTNSKADGRFHSNWLSMMYPRLRLARNLLMDEGVILISIDDNEIHHLRLLMNELFGEENYVGSLVWEKKKKGAFLSGNVTNIKEYILVYSKNITCFEGLIGEIAKDEETYPVIKTTNSRGFRTIKKGIISKYKEKDHFVPVGTRISAGNQEMILHSDMIIKNGILQEKLDVESNWIYSQDLLDLYADNKELYVTQDLYFRRIVKEPRYKRLKDILFRVGENGVSGSSYQYSDNLYLDGWGTNEDGNAELHDLLGVQNLFDFPKPSKLLAKLFFSTRDKECIILDFFGGSGTTAQAIYELNKADNGKRKFIIIQLKEKCDTESEAYKAGYSYITDVTKKRIREVCKKTEGGGQDIEYSGFKTFRLTNSNYKLWRNVDNVNVSDLELKFGSFESALIDEWKFPDLLNEILLMEGFPLDSKIEEASIYKKNRVQTASSDFCQHHLVICLDKKVSPDTIKSLQLNENDIFVCLDNAVTDEQKVTLSDKGLIKTI